MSKITYDDKVALEEQTTIADINKVNANDMNEIKEVVNANDDRETTNFNNLKGTILWRNTSPYSSFPPQNITLSSGDYDMLEIIYLDYAERRGVHSTKAPKNVKIELQSIFGWDSKTYAGSRSITFINNTTLQVYQNWGLIDSNIVNPIVVNDWNIPMYVIGYKTGMFE